MGHKKITRLLIVGPCEKKVDKCLLYYFFFHKKQLEYHFFLFGFFLYLKTIKSMYKTMVKLVLNHVQNVIKKCVVGQNTYLILDPNFYNRKD